MAAAFSLVAIGACTDAAGEATAPNAPSTPVASISVATVPAALYEGYTVRLSAVARDAHGDVIPGVRIEWQASDPNTVVVEAGGRVTARRAGAARISASAGGTTASVPVGVRLTEQTRRLAYAWVHDPVAAASYAPAAGYAYNGTGGGVRVTRQGTGDYLVSFERMAKAEPAFREAVLVTAYGGNATRCHANGWGSSPNERDLDVSVSCYDFGGDRRDSRFNVLVVGSNSLPSRLGFTVAGGTGTLAPDAARTFESSEGEIAINRSVPGSYLVQWNAPATGNPQNYLVSTLGGPADMCRVSSWNATTWANVICYGPAGSLRDARFSLLLVEQGRAEKRFAFALADRPSAPVGESYQPSAASQRSSSGSPVRVTRQGTGVYQVSFPGLAKTGVRPETVHVSPYGGGAGSCQVQGWSNGADDTSLETLVRCWNRATGLAADAYFTILVLE